MEGMFCSSPLLDKSLIAIMVVIVNQKILPFEKSDPKYVVDTIIVFTYNQITVSVVCIWVCIHYNGNYNFFSIKLAEPLPTCWGPFRSVSLLFTPQRFR